MSLAKGLAIGLGVAAGVGALAFAGGAIAHEYVLNVERFKKIGDKMNMAENLPELFPENEYFDAVNAWYNSQDLTDHYISYDCDNRSHALIFKNETPTDKWVILLHGYISCPEDMKAFAYEYSRMGFNCLIMSMRGHDKDSNKYCSMGYHDKHIVIAWIKHIISQNSDAKIFLHGISMGAATALMATGVGVPDNVKAVVSDCSFTNCYEQYRNAMKNTFGIPPFPLLDLLNIASIAIDGFNLKKTSPIDAVKHSTTPTLFIHGSMDDFVDISMLEELYDACNAEKEMLIIEGAHHSDSNVIDSENYWNTVKEFIEKHM